FNVQYENLRSDALFFGKMPLVIDPIKGLVIR
ncbi:MAG: hypothetical protein RJB36_946, partial [Bacteroidota bacterium]